MDGIVRLGSLFLVAALLFAANPSWKDHPTSQWNEEDGKQVLADSPWVKFVMPQYVRDLSPDERMQGGNWEADSGHGVGLAGIGLFGPTRQAEAIARAHAKPPVGTVVVRWKKRRSHPGGASSRRPAKPACPLSTPPITPLPSRSMTSPLPNAGTWRMSSKALPF